MTEMGATPARAQWMFLTNHAHVLLSIARNPGVRLRDVAATVGITERAAQRLVADLEADGYLSRTRIGRRNQYRIRGDLPLRHPVERQHEIGELVRLLAPEAPGLAPAAPVPSAPVPPAPVLSDRAPAGAVPASRRRAERSGLARAAPAPKGAQRATSKARNR